MTSRRGRRGLVAGTGVIAGLLVMSSVAWGCQAFRGRAFWEGNGVAGSSTDGTNGNLHYPPTSGATWDLTTDGIGAAGQAHRHCYDTFGEKLPGAGLDLGSGNPNWYPATGGTAPVVRMVAGANGADLALKIEPSPVCLDPNVVPGINKMPALSGSNGYEVYTAVQEGAALNGTSNDPNACHVRQGGGGGQRVSAANAVNIDASGYSVDGSGNPTTYVLENFRAGGTAGTYRMICLWDESNETSDAHAINVKVI